MCYCIVCSLIQHTNCVSATTHLLVDHIKGNLDCWLGKQFLNSFQWLCPFLFNNALPEHMYSLKQIKSIHNHIYIGICFSHYTKVFYNPDYTVTHVMRKYYLRNGNWIILFCQVSTSYLKINIIVIFIASYKHWV